MWPMELAERFVAAVTKVYDRVGAGDELLPMVLARACVNVLPVTGAGLSITHQLRIPLGASDETAASAERLQTTLGEGPCLVATATLQPQLYDEKAMARTWPVFHHEFVTQTPYRSVASFPLLTPQRHRFGALDLYSTDPDAQPFQSLSDMGAAVVGPISIVLFNSPTTGSQNGIPVPSWMAATSTVRRNNVWVAVGLMIQYGHLSSSNALDLLRAYSFGHSTTLDETADQLTTHRLLPKAVLAG
jgi:hypothetical protein